MTRKSIKQEVWRLIFIPALTITLLLASTLSYLFVIQLNKFVANRGEILTLKTAHLAYYALASEDEQLLHSIMDASLEEPYVRAIHIYHAKTQTHYHAGPQFYPNLTATETNSLTPGHHKTDQSLRFFNPITDHQTNRQTDIQASAQKPETLGWIELEFLTSPFIVLRYEMLFITITITLLCLILAALLAIRLHDHITTPLEHITSVVRKLAKGKLHARIDTQKTLEFTELTETVNAMGAVMEKAQRDMQLHVDQYTDDLRETLETIEVQNIELDIARKQALEGSRIKSEFLANTSHEIRTPLNGILGFTNLALKTELDDQQREYIDTIRDSAQNLLTIINDILDFSKIEAGKLTLEYVPLPLRRVLEDALHILAPDAHEKHLQLITHIDPNVPASLLGDPLRLKQIISNLASNAIKFSQRGNIIIKVTLVSQKEKQIVIKFSIKDQGIGISQSQRERLFKAFTQADTSSAREHGGTGLGLAICKGLVERMGGNIGIESELEQGAEFWFTARFGVDKKQPPLNNAILKEKNILICGDNNESNSQIVELLTIWQANYHTVPTIHDIFPCLRNPDSHHKEHNRIQAYDVVIIDIAPEDRKTHYNLLHKLSEQLKDEFNCDVVVCCTSAHQRLFRSGSEKLRLHYASKPINYDGLLHVLSHLFDISFKDQQVALNLETNLRSNPSVLIVDDNPANLQLASELLRGLNTQVTQASNGKQALSACDTESFDIIFMDIQMPGIDGIETTRQIRALEGTKKRTPIIALTAHSMTEQKADLLIAGMDDCISKPVSEAQLAHIINRWASLSGKKEVVPTTGFRVAQPTLTTINSNNDDITSIDIALSLKLANHKPALARDMLSMLLKGLPDEQQQINQAFSNQDFEQLEILIHRLFGSCCYCGVPRLKKISGLLDRLLQSQQYDQIDSVITALNNAIADILRWAEDRDINKQFGLKSLQSDDEQLN